MSWENFNCGRMEPRRDLRNVAKWRQWTILVSVCSKTELKSEFLLFCSDDDKIGFFWRRYHLRRNPCNQILFLHRNYRMIHCSHFKTICKFFWPFVRVLLRSTHDKSGKSDTNSVISLVPGWWWWNPRSEKLPDGLVLTRRTRGYMWKKFN